MAMLYNLGIALLGLLYNLAAVLNPKAGQWVLGRKNWRQHLKAALQGNTLPVAWFHCASLGEFEQARPVIEGFKQQHPGYFILLTFFSPSGYNLRKDYKGASHVCYLPLDTPGNAKDFIGTTKPSLGFFVKYEFWRNHITEARLNGTTLVAFSTIFRASQIYFKGYGTFFSAILKGFNHIFVQDEGSRQLLKSIGIETASLAGDTRFDRVTAIAAAAKDIPLIDAFKGAGKLMVAGSTWHQDTETLTAAINAHPELKVIIAPHEIREPYLRDLEQTLTGGVIRFSDATAEAVNRHHVLVIDNIGMLSSLYAYADFAFVGGAYGKGLHNILEAAVYGIPVLFGTNYHKFREAVDLVKLGGAISCTDGISVKKNIEILINDEVTCSNMGQVCLDYVRNNLGATHTILAYCKQIA